MHACTEAFYVVKYQQQLKANQEARKKGLCHLVLSLCMCIENIMFSKYNTTNSDHGLTDNDVVDKTWY